MSLFTLQEAHPTYRLSPSLGHNPQTRQTENVDKPLPSLQAAALRNPAPKETSLNALDPYHYVEAPSWYTSPHGPPYHSRALEAFQNQQGQTGCGQTKMHLMTCSSCRRQSLMLMASDFAFYFLLGLGLIYASKRL